MTDVLVIGGGHNGLVTATVLAKSGLKVVVLERSDRPGGCARTVEIAPGFRAPLAHAAAIDRGIAQSLGLERHGLEIVRPDAMVCAPAGDGRALALWHDPREAARELQAFSARDAEQYPAFLDSVRSISHVVRALLDTPPPSIDDPSAGDLLGALKAGRAFRSLGRADAYRVLRWLPMAAGDFAGEWFESEPLRATVAAGGILGAFLGPWSAGSTAQLLLLAARDGHPIGSGWFARGGTGAVADALAGAAQQAGVDIRTGAEVVAVTVRGDAATGAVLQNGDELPARVIVSNLDPKRTLLRLVDPACLDPEFRRRVQNIRTHGTLAKVNYAIDAVPRLASLAARAGDRQVAAMSGRIRLAPTVDDIERAFDAAKYGSFADAPWIELTIPSLLDSSLAPAGQHVVSAYVQYAPYHLRGTTWDRERSRLAAATTATIDRYAPGFASSVIAQQTITPLDLEQTYGLTGGHIFHGELALDQLFLARPTLGWARYETPIRNLYLCGSGTHPGTGLDGRSGALAAKVIAAALRR
jgi:phytoene dehydrogenase-like protein